MIHCARFPRDIAKVCLDANTTRILKSDNEDQETEVLLTISLVLHIKTTQKAKK